MSNVGLISYSLYLWHHPILSFGKISGLTENSLFYKFLLIGVSFIFSILTYVYVEQKFRKKNSVETKFSNDTSISYSMFFLNNNFLPNKQEKQFPSI